MLRRIFIGVLGLFICSSLATAFEKKLTVYAAASLTDVLPRVADAWQAAGGEAITFNFAGSSRLAMQIQAGAPADLFFSASVEWMEHLDGEMEHRVDLLGNELVVAVSKSASSPAQNPHQRFDFSNVSRLALAGENVPAGKYAELSLKNTKDWDGLRAQLIRGGNVRTILGWLGAGDVPAAIVYRTDALSAGDSVTIAAVLPQNSYDPIIYPAAVLRRSKQRQLARKFLQFCQTKTAADIFRSAHFKIIDRR